MKSSEARRSRYASKGSCPPQPPGKRGCSFLSCTKPSSKYRNSLQLLVYSRRKMNYLLSWHLPITPMNSLDGFVTKYLVIFQRRSKHSYLTYQIESFSTRRLHGETKRLRQLVATRQNLQALSNTGWTDDKCIFLCPRVSHTKA